MTSMDPCVAPWFPGRFRNPAGDAAPLIRAAFPEDCAGRLCRAIILGGQGNGKIPDAVPGDVLLPVSYITIARPRSTRGRRTMLAATPLPGRRGARSRAECKQSCGRILSEVVAQQSIQPGALAAQLQ